MNIYGMGVVFTVIFVGGPLLTACGAGWLFGELLDRRKLRRTVYANLDNAYDGGQFETDGYCANQSVFELAVDLTCYAEDCYRLDARKLVPYVRNWLFQKGIPCKG